MPRNYPFQFWRVIVNISNINVLFIKVIFPPNQGRPVGCGLHGMDLFVNKCLIDVAFRALEEENSKLVINADVDVTIANGL